MQASCGHLGAEHVRPQDMTRHAGKALNIKNTVRRDAAPFPLGQCCWGDGESAGQRSRAARFSNGLGGGQTDRGVAHGADHKAALYVSASAKGEEVLYGAKAWPALASPSMKKQNLAIVEHQEAMGARLRLVITALGLSNAEAARQMGVSAQRLNGWLSGAHPPSIFHLAQFCAVQPVTLDWLVLGDARALPVATAERLGLVSVGRQAAQPA